MSVASVRTIPNNPRWILQVNMMVFIQLSCACAFSIAMDAPRLRITEATVEILAIFTYLLVFSFSFTWRKPRTWANLRATQLVTFTLLFCCLLATVRAGSKENTSWVKVAVEVVWTECLFRCLYLHWCLEYVPEYRTLPGNVWTKRDTTRLSRRPKIRPFDTKMVIMALSLGVVPYTALLTWVTEAHFKWHHVFCSAGAACLVCAGLLSGHLEMSHRSFESKGDLIGSCMVCWLHASGVRPIIKFFDCIPEYVSSLSAQEQAPSQGRSRNKAQKTKETDDLHIEVTTESTYLLRGLTRNRSRKSLTALEDPKPLTTQSLTEGLDSPQPSNASLYGTTSGAEVPSLSLDNLDIPPTMLSQPTSPEQHTSVKLAQAILPYPAERSQSLPTWSTNTTATMPVSPDRYANKIVPL
eukprot:g67371.t1